MTRTILSTRKAFRHLAVVAATLLLASCAEDAPLDTLGDQLAGPEAQSIGSFMTWILWICYAVFAIVLGITIFSWRNFRIKTDEYEEGDWPEQIHGNTTAELAWTAGPAILLAVVAVFTLGLHSSINSNSENAISLVVGDETVVWEPEIVVIGQQWWWEYQYHFGDVDLVAQRVENLPTADLTTATQMVIPVGMEVELEVTSRDVIHSYWIPSLNGKRDAVPGRQSAPWKIQADEPGVYFGQCTEFCGLSHSRMRMQVIALEMADFQLWVTSQMEGVALSAEDQAYVDSLVAGDTPGPENSTQRAIATFRSKCASCHLMDNVADDLWSEEQVREQLVAGAAPNLTHFSSRTTFAGGIRNVWDPDTGIFNSNDLRIWLQNPEAIKANFAMPASEGDSRMRGMPNLGLSTQEIDDLVALLESTGEKPSDEIIKATGVE
ncbi:MAG: cytochrome c oxidase subunit II [Acidimicrobiia bacterium]|nr:cytochrome c oxidase subunit II [Acidimicrobiia bacterium]